MGIYIFEPAILKYIGFNQYLDLPDLVLKLIEAGERVMSYPFDGYWMDLGRVEDYEQAVAEFEGLKPQILGEQFVESGVNLLESRLAFQDFLAPANNKPRQP
jgi:NDP-sugar pyrophosphorylase family protein